jgi:hypothetical protein
MMHKELLETLKQLLNLEDSDIKAWYPNGRGSIRVSTTKFSYDLVFTHVRKGDWKLETMRSYLNDFSKLN